jgi:hypothetical protein
MENIQPKSEDGATSQGSVGAGRLVWSPDQPAEQGWYWARPAKMSDALVPFVLFVERLSDGSLTCLTPDGDTYPITDAAKNTLWAGPIPEPEADGTEAEPSSLVDEILGEIQGTLLMSSGLKANVRAAIARALSRAERKG